ncbi:MAG TPA: DNA-processing protein DprA [Solirubrobacteraceae bacterium]|nr:DNA-processing protein DprA [Solirubrobacteraceae bacterium]
MTGACGACLRRSWLLAALSAGLAYQARDRERLLELLALGDEDLVQAIGGRRRSELQERYARFTPEEVRLTADVETICRHHRGYPRALTQMSDGAPRMLYVSGTAQRLAAQGSEPAVAIVGSRRATDYGMEMARSLARGLAASGVTVAGGLSDGIAVAALAGALEAGGRTLTVMDAGLDVACPARRRTLFQRARMTGCAVAELPCGARSRNWCYTARERIVTGLAELTIVVEADESPGELLGAHVAQALGRTVAAVPGRVTSPVSRGTHALLMEGAALVRGPEDALDLLYRGNPPRSVDAAGTPKRSSTKRQSQQLEPRLQMTLEQVGAGRDTPAKLTAGSADAGEVLLALSELEAMGLLTRGDGGRYVPRESLAGRAPL